ncbi:MAG: hypothetical protein JWN07_1799 [Hyphomicrobiales bacterium]|nr:hypothetical protein [Hyphomicrobiales bacterium]
MGTVQRLGRLLPGPLQLSATTRRRGAHAAAGALNIAQSSRARAALEPEIDITLVERSARGLRRHARSRWRMRSFG